MVRRALLVALFCAVAAVCLLFLYVKRYEQEASGGAPVSVLVALKPLDRGAPITEEAIGVRNIPQAYVEDRAIRASEKSKILGVRVGGLVQAQQTLMWTDLAVASEERRELSTLVQPGRRAATIRVRNDAMGSLVLPGDSVDVIAVSGGAGGSADKRTASVLLQHVLVLAVGRSLTAEAIDPGAHSAAFGDLTLSVTLPEAQLLALAAERGMLSVVVRSTEDTQTTDRLPDVTLGNGNGEHTGRTLLSKTIPTELPAIGTVRP